MRSVHAIVIRDSSAARRRVRDSELRHPPGPAAPQLTGEGMQGPRSSEGMFCGKSMAGKCVPDVMLKTAKLCARKLQQLIGPVRKERLTSLPALLASFPSRRVQEAFPLPLPPPAGPASYSSPPPLPGEGSLLPSFPPNQNLRPPLSAPPFCTPQSGLHSENLPAWGLTLPTSVFLK